jgi:hypothetical protein
MESRIRELELSKIEKEIKDKEQELKRLKDKYYIVEWGNVRKIISYTEAYYMLLKIDYVNERLFILTQYDLFYIPNFCDLFYIPIFKIKVKEVNK